MHNMTNNNQVFVLGTATPSDCADFILRVLIEICLKSFIIMLIGTISLLLLYGITKGGKTTVKNEKVEKSRFGSLALLREREKKEAGIFANFIN
jgi:hypothetical protein